MNRLNLRRSWRALHLLLPTLFLIAPTTAATPDQDGDHAPALKVWAVDPLVKVFRDAPPEEYRSIIAEVARGEHATWQIVVRCDRPITHLRIEPGPLTLQEGNQIAPAKHALRARFVGYVHLDRPTPKASSDQLRNPPADFPDPLLEDETIDIEANAAQPIWIDFAVPPDPSFPAGRYESDVRITAEIGGQRIETTVPIETIIHDVTVGPSRLWVTNWYFQRFNHIDPSIKAYTPAFWDLLRRFARNMAEHRQNVAWISPYELAQYSLDEDGTLAIDFSRFDQWVEIFIEEGVIGLIEGRHIGTRSGDWYSPFVVRAQTLKDGSLKHAMVDPAGPEAEAFYSQFLPALVKHLRAKGWLDQYVQHLADEPITQNIESYRAMAALVRKHAVELRIIEACHTKDLVGAMDVWVPQLNYLHNDFEHYQQRQEAGEEVWFYTCMFPQGDYANRFIELPLIKTRLLHWINYRYGLTGYLHWGYNAWRDDLDPFANASIDHPAGSSILPGGDAWIVYPGKDGPLDSIRWETMRDGIADYELLCMLAERDPAAAKRLAAKHILDFDRYDCDVQAFRATRRGLLKLLSAP